jgi:hypothetical protein
MKTRLNKKGYRWESNSIFLIGNKTYKSFIPALNYKNKTNQPIYESTETYCNGKLVVAETKEI